MRWVLVVAVVVGCGGKVAADRDDAAAAKAYKCIELDVVKSSATVCRTERAACEPGAPPWPTFLKERFDCAIDRCTVRAWCGTARVKLDARGCTESFEADDEIVRDCLRGIAVNQAWPCGANTTVIVERPCGPPKDGGP